jgi:hypothetical protein
MHCSKTNPLLLSGVAKSHNYFAAPAMGKKILLIRAPMAVERFIPYMTKKNFYEKKIIFFAFIGTLIQDFFFIFNILPLQSLIP